MSKEPVWLDHRLVLAIHGRVLVEHGGRAGVRDEGLLESALARPRNLRHYQRASLYELAAAYAAGICRNHPLVDGNKRVALMAVYVFLARNGVVLRAGEADAAAAVTGLAAGTLPESQFSAWLKKNTERPARPVKRVPGGRE
ncbi:MAG TPA: type II toxin-antitoxin system death-on-curing family toxin [Bryobacteraceae bacterium]|nr:type II toxin-antitoxin system death-on-curing family toxin [Bryobacteraceae bacterium]